MHLLDSIYVCLLLLNVILLIVTWIGRGLHAPLRYLAILFSSIIALEILANFLYQPDENNLVLYHIHNPIEFALFSMYFYEIVSSNKIRRLILFLIPCYILFAVTVSIRLQAFEENNNYQIITGSLLLISYCLLYLREILLNNIEQPLQAIGHFWIVVGICLYFISILFLEGSLNELLEIDNGIARKYYKLGFLFKYLLCIFCLIGIMLENNFRLIKLKK